MAARLADQLADTKLALDEAELLKEHAEVQLSKSFNRERYYIMLLRALSDMVEAIAADDQEKFKTCEAALFELQFNPPPEIEYAMLTPYPEAS
jgi:hypothetical protein